MRRRMGRALVAGAVVGGVAHHAGRVSAENDAREQQQSAQIADLQAQQDQMTQQQVAQQPQYAPPPPQYAPPPPQYAPPPPPYAPVEAPAAAPAAAASAARQDRATQGTRRVEGVGGAHRGGVPGREGQDPQRLNLCRSSHRQTKAHRGAERVRKRTKREMRHEYTCGLEVRFSGWRAADARAVADTAETAVAAGR